MKRRIVLAAVMTAVLSMPAAALATDQEVDVQVLPTDTLGINIHGGVYFAIEIGQSAEQPFGMDITNTMDGGWTVTVDGTDLQGYTPENCDETGCDRIPTGITIARSNVVVTGGDLCWGGPDCTPATDPVITASTVALGDTGPLMVGTADAHGLFGFGPPSEPMVKVTIPEGSAQGQYYTTITYTIMPAP